MEPRKQLSVIVPTYNEVDNVKPLCERLFAAGAKHKLEIDLLLMDDESVGSEQTKAIVDELANKYAIRYDARFSVRYCTVRCWQTTCKHNNA